MRSSTVLFSLLSLLSAVPLSAQSMRYEAVDPDADLIGGGGERSLPAHRSTSVAVVTTASMAEYGPFRVMDGDRAALVNVTDANSPAQFAAMLMDHPGIKIIEMVDCPGTEDDLANLRLGRMIHERGLATYVPKGGSVRSGGVELFLAGVQRYADPAAEFAVHSWQDDTGLQAHDYSDSAPENRRYIEYYRQMGMSPIEAEAFYEMTNSVPFDSAKWFGTGVMGLWIDLDRTENAAASADRPLILDSSLTLQ